MGAVLGVLVVLVVLAMFVVLDFQRYGLLALCYLQKILGHFEHALHLVEEW